MALTTGILLFDDAEELDYVGPWEVFTSARNEGDRVVTIAERDAPIRSAKGLRVLPDCTFDDAPDLDIVLVPGGMGTRREVDNPVLIEWLATTAERCTWVTSVCTGAYLLHRAGPAAWSRNEPVHTLVTQVADSLTLPSHSVRTGLSTSRRVPIPPGTRMTSRGGASSKVWSGTTRSPLALRTGSGRWAIVTTASPFLRALARTSQGPA